MDILVKNLTKCLNLFVVSDCLLLHLVTMARYAFEAPLVTKVSTPCSKSYDVEKCKILHAVRAESRKEILS